MASSDRLPEILEAIEQSLDEPDCDGDALAARLFLSRFHFSRIASAVLGEAPGAFRRRILQERAAVASRPPLRERDPLPPAWRPATARN
jgi:AraC-like DNA-binding protein